MDWDDLRFFLALARSGSVSQAGRSLGVTHTTVARRIAALESNLGARLFDRTADGYAMTQTGEDILASAESVEEVVFGIDRQVFGKDRSLTGELRVTMPYDFANAVLVPELPDFLRRYPDIDLELLTTTGTLDLQARQADLAVRLTPNPPDYLVGRRVLPLMHGVYAAPVLLRRSNKSPPVVLHRSERELPEWVRHHFPKASVVLRTDSVATMCEAVKAGLGFARMPCFVGDQERRLRRLKLELTPSKWGAWVLNHADLKATARVRAGREFVTEALLKHRGLVLGENSRFA